MRRFEQGKQYYSEFKVKKYCSHKCYTSSNKGAKHYMWKGGIRQRSDGYLRYSDDRYVHRVTMEKHLGRKLLSKEHVHHINGDPADNSIENLELHTNSSHRKLESKLQSRNKHGQFIKEAE